MKHNVFILSAGRGSREVPAALACSCKEKWIESMVTRTKGESHAEAVWEVYCENGRERCEIWGCRGSGGVLLQKLARLSLPRAPVCSGEQLHRLPPSSQTTAAGTVDLEDAEASATL